MKTIIKLAVAAMLVVSVDIAAQQSSPNKISVIQPDSLNIAYSKTTNIVFPFSITSVDRGSRDVLAQKAIGVENILQIKAAKECFNETNLTVVTADGKLYSFVINYGEQPQLLNIAIGGNKRSGSGNFLAKGTVNEAEIQGYSKLAYNEKQRNLGLRDKKQGIGLEINGIFIHGELMYFRVVVSNNSNIDYDIEQLRFFIEDSKKARRTASQELEVIPVYIHNNTEKIKTGDTNTFVFAVPKFTIPEKKFLSVQLVESSGGRHLDLEVKNKKIRNVIILPAFN